MVRILYTGKYQRNLKELTEEIPDIEKEVDKRVKWFKSNPDDTRLVNHPLRKSMEGKWAFSINGDTRIVYQWLGKTSVRFLAIGRHVRVYPRN